MSSKSISETSNDQFIMEDPAAGDALNDAEKKALIRQQF